MCALNVKISHCAYVRHVYAKDLTWVGGAVVCGIYTITTTPLLLPPAPPRTFIICTYTSKTIEGGRESMICWCCKCVRATFHFSTWYRIYNINDLCYCNSWVEIDSIRLYTLTHAHVCTTWYGNDEKPHRCWRTVSHAEHIYTLNTQHSPVAASWYQIMACLLASIAYLINFVIKNGAYC